METVSIDGLVVPVLRPTTVAEACAIVKEQRAKREAVYPVGGRTMLDFGLPPTKSGVALDTTALNAVIDYPWQDMTITVQAGITFAKLQETLATHNQWLPLDVPDPEKMTIGGLIACNVSGPRRLGYGTLRDYLIGISFICDDGVEVKGGGRVVKNVAGYDLMKLNIGALGTMGVITQVTLKVRPRPEASCLVIIDTNDEGLLFWNDRWLLNTNCMPVIANYTTKGNDGGQLLLGFDDNTQALQWQLNQIDHDATANNQPVTIHNDDMAIREIARRQYFNSARYIWKLALKPFDVLDEVSNSPGIAMSCELRNGIVWVFGDKLRGFSDHASYCMIKGDRTARKEPSVVFGLPTVAWELMKHVQRTLDPDGVFNPGRMFA